MDQHDRGGDTTTFSEKARALAMQAEETLRTYHRLLEEHGITSDSCLAELRRVGWRSGGRESSPRGDMKKGLTMTVNPFSFGAGEMNRTPDLLITNELLYRLSYTG
jgi:hypothetical protein